MNRSAVINRLTAWSKWKMNSGTSLGYPSRVSFLRSDGGGSGQIDRDRLDRDRHDAWCNETNDAVKKLPLFHQLIIRIEYLSTGGSVLMKSRRLGIDGRTFRRYLSNSYERIDNIFDSGLFYCPDNDINVLNQL